MQAHREISRAAVATGPSHSQSVFEWFSSDAMLTDYVGRLVRAMAYQFGLDPDDLGQKVRIAVWQKGHSLRNLGALKPWLISVCRHICLNEVRRAQTETRTVDSLRQQAASPAKLNGACLIQWHDRTNPESEILRSERDEFFRAVTREVMLRFPAWLTEGFSEGLSARQISEKSGKPLSTVHRRLKLLEKAIVRELAEATEKN
jgi:RNA polymerase sigma factor (sigma-70 family)